MTNIIRIIGISMLSIIVLMSVISCGSSITQEEYDSVVSELNSVKSQLAEQQDKLAEYEAKEAQYLEYKIQYDELKKQYDAQADETQALKSQYDELNTRYKQLEVARNNEIQGLQADYDKLNDEFEDLKAQYDTITQGNVIFDEAEIEQTIFELINDERKNNGVDELLWGVNLYKWAKQNSREMAESGDLKLSEWASWQEILITSRQCTLEGLAKGAMTIWKNNIYRYNYNVINAQCIYGAVAVYQENNIYYITYMASTYR